MVSNSVKRTVNLVCDYSSLVSATAGGFGLSTDNPSLTSASIILWGLTKVIQTKLGYAYAGGPLNTDYFDMCLSRDGFAGFSGLFLGSKVYSSEPYHGWQGPATDLVFPALATISHVFRRRNLKELEAKLSHSNLSSSDTLPLL